jgi:broad specificity phosphatase PhoE
VPRRLYLARHGETDWNANGRLQGTTDIPLNERGREHGRVIAARLASHQIAEVITSDLSRARETGAIVAELLGLPDPRVVPELRERSFGTFEGLTRDQIIANHPEAWRRWQAQTDVPEGAELLAAATARMHTVLRALADEAGGPALVVSHGGIMRLWLVDVAGPSISPLVNGATYVCDRSDSGWAAAFLE